jgi:hypothetical protein
LLSCFKFMSKLLLPILSLAVVLSACGKKEAAPQEAAAPKQAVSVDGPANDTPPPPPPNVPAPDPAAAEPESPAGPAASDDVLAAYNRELAAWINQRDYVPTDMADLKKRTGLPPLPKPPPGRRIVYVPNPNYPTMSKIVLE